jgi:hypothetical protein
MTLFHSRFRNRGQSSRSIEQYFVSSRVLYIRAMGGCRLNVTVRLDGQVSFFSIFC